MATTKISKASKDRISNLPSSLLSHILSLLPTKCAVATSVLSTKWRFLWTSVTNLDFDDTGYGPKKSLNMKRIKFTKFVNRVLLLLNPSCIQNFRLKCSQELSDPFYLESWIFAAIQRTVGVLDFSSSLESGGLMELPFRHMYCNAKVLKLNGDIYFNIPAQASACFLFLQTLHLSNIKFEFAKNSFIGFPSLKVLHLNYVKYENEDSIHKLFSGCSVLEDLVVKRNYWDNVLSLIICIPSLARLKLDFRYRDARLRASDDDDDHHHHAYKLQMEKLHNLKFLSILGDALKAIGTASANISSGFHNLVQLELEKKYCHDWSVVIKNLLESMHNLEHLTLKGNRCYNSDHSWWTEPYKVPICLRSRVTTISFIYMINVDCDELELLRYFLKNAEVLELLTINTYYSSSEIKLKLVEKVSLLPRGSRTCQVAFT